MANYYIVLSAVFIIAIVSVTTMVIHALNKKGDVDASFWSKRFGFRLSAKDRASGPPQSTAVSRDAPADPSWGDGNSSVFRSSRKPQGGLTLD